MDLQEIRKEIDAVDDKIARLLKERLILVDRVAEIKRETNAPVLNLQREEEIINRLTGGGNDDFIKEVFLNIFELSRKRQELLL